VHIAANKYLLDTGQRKFNRTILDDRTREADSFDDALRLADESDIFEANRYR
jgi:hypothetical protein